MDVYFLYITLSLKYDQYMLIYKFAVHTLFTFLKILCIVNLLVYKDRTSTALLIPYFNYQFRTNSEILLFPCDIMNIIFYKNYAKYIESVIIIFSFEAKVFSRERHWQLKKCKARMGANKESQEVIMDITLTHGILRKYVLLLMNTGFMRGICA